MKFSCAAFSAPDTAENCARRDLAAEARNHQQNWNLELDLNAKRIPRVCLSRKHFHTIRGGARMKSVYDVKTATIYLRSPDSTALKHEAAHHFTIEVLPKINYTWSEKLVTCLLEPGRLKKKLSRADFIRLERTKLTDFPEEDRKICHNLFRYPDYFER